MVNLIGVLNLLAQVRLMRKMRIGLVMRSFQIAIILLFGKKIPYGKKF